MYITYLSATHVFKREKESIQTQIFDNTVFKYLTALFDRLVYININVRNFII
jgi:hypothetical protein